MNTTGGRAHRTGTAGLLRGKVVYAFYGTLPREESHYSNAVTPPGTAGLLRGPAKLDHAAPVVVSACKGSLPRAVRYYSKAVAPPVLLLFTLLVCVCCGTYASADDLPADGVMSYQDIPVTRWTGPGTPDTYQEYASGRHATPSRLQQIYPEQSPLLRTSSEDVLVLVEDRLWPGLSTYIERYVADVESEDHTVRLLVGAFDTAEQLKASIIAEGPQVSGVVLIGDMPTAWYEIEDDYDKYGYAQFPCDLYLSDTDGLWEDNLQTSPMQAGVYDTHTAGSGDMGPELFVGRIDASRMSGYDELLTLQVYFDRLHAWYARQTTPTDRALTYTDDDWAGISYFSTSIQSAYDYDDAIKAPDTSRDDYRYTYLPSMSYDYVQLSVHSSSTGHSFERGGWLTNTQLAPAPPNALHYNLFACSACRFTSTSCLGNTYLFADGARTLSVVGSTKTGSMLSFTWFYSPLGDGECTGRALQQWFDSVAPFSEYETWWHYGMVLLGDPLVSIYFDCNGNGVADHIELAQGGVTDADNNGIPDSCEACGDAHHPYPPGDVSSDCVVNQYDMNLLHTQWQATGCTDPLWCDGTDITRNGSVNMEDAAEVISRWQLQTWPPE